MTRAKPRFRFYNSFNNYFLVFQFLIEKLFFYKKNYLKQLSRNFEKKFNIKYAIPIPQNRYGVYLLMKQLITKNKPYVIVPAYTIHDVVNMIICAGGKPIFVDIDEETLNLDIKDLEKVINQDVSAVLVTHLHGLISNLNQIKDLCDKHSISLIEDSAQSFGGHHNLKINICHGLANIVSFGRAKNINSFFGGIILTNDDNLAKSTKDYLSRLPFESGIKLTKRIILSLFYDLLSAPIIFPYFTHNLLKAASYFNITSINKLVQTENNPKRKVEIPKNYETRMTNLQAKLILDQIDKLEKDTLYRVNVAKIYHKSLEKIDDIKLPPFRDDLSHVYLQFPIQVNNRNSFTKFMTLNGSDIAIQHLNNVAGLDIFSDFYRNCNNAEIASKKVVLLPTYPKYGINTVYKNIKLINSYFKK